MWTCCVGAMEHIVKRLHRYISGDALPAKLAACDIAVVPDLPNAATVTMSIAPLRGWAPRGRRLKAEAPASPLEDKGLFGSLTRYQRKRWYSDLCTPKE